MKQKLKDFKQVQDHWYAKLKKEGFKDIERDGYLNWHSSSQALQSYMNNRLAGIEAKINYYRIAGFFLNDYPFDTLRDKLIWSQHAEGESIRNISKYLKTQSIKYIKPTQVKETIHRLRNIMYKIYKDLENND